MQSKARFLPVLTVLFILVLFPCSGCQSMKGDHHEIKHDQEMTREIGEDLALMKKLRKEEAGEKESLDETEEDVSAPPKEKKKGIFFLSDKGNQIRDNLER